MIDSYWDLYIVYIDKCVRENYANDIDPHHYEMEENHFLPKCLFKGHGPTQWLTLKQHAIASALQTLALRKNCMTGMMKKYLSEKLLELAWPFYGLGTAERNRKQTGELHPMFGRTGELNPMFGKKNPGQSERNKLRTGELHPMFGKERPEHSERMSGELNPMFGRTGELHPAFGKKWWVNDEGKTYRGVEPPGPDWQNGLKWKV